MCEVTDNNTQYFCSQRNLFIALQCFVTAHLDLLNDDKHVEAMDLTIDQNCLWSMCDMRFFAVVNFLFFSSYRLPPYPGRRLVYRRTYPPCFRLYLPTQVPPTLIHSLIHSLTHSSTLSHTLTHSLTHSLTRSLIHSLTFPLTHINF